MLHRRSLSTLLALACITRINGLTSPSPFRHQTSVQRSLQLHAQQEATDEDEVQWSLFKKHHARGEWRGIWTTYDYIGDVMDETVASVNYQCDQEAPDDAVVNQIHTIVAGAKRSDCATCFDSMELKSFPVATYSKGNLGKSRFAANAMITGPSLLRSGLMATEMILSHGDGRVRVTFQHAPVWEAGVEPGSCPPQGLKLARTMVSREALRETAPTAETEAAEPPAGDDPTIFFRPVPPFNWHKKWAGTSWTWGPQSGDRGWSIEQIEEEDAWQGIATVERWNLRLPGGVFIQAPRVITDASSELCRLAWLPNDDTLLRVEAGVMALQPMIMDDDQLVGFYPPSLATLRCDVLKKMGELENLPSFVKMSADDDEFLKPMSEIDAISTPSPSASSTSLPKTSTDENDGECGLEAIRNALQL